MPLLPELCNHDNGRSVGCCRGGGGSSWGSSRGSRHVCVRHLGEKQLAPLPVHVLVEQWPANAKWRWQAGEIEASQKLLRTCSIASKSKNRKITSGEHGALSVVLQLLISLPHDMNDMPSCHRTCHFSISGTRNHEIERATAASIFHASVSWLSRIAPQEVAPWCSGVRFWNVSRCLQKTTGQASAFDPSSPPDFHLGHLRFHQMPWAVALLSYRYQSIAPTISQKCNIPTVRDNHRHRSHRPSKDGIRCQGPIGAQRRLLSFGGRVGESGGRSGTRDVRSKLLGRPQLSPNKAGQRSAGSIQPVIGAAEALGFFAWGVQRRFVPPG